MSNKKNTKKKTTTQSTNRGSGGLSAGKVVGIVAGALGIAAILGFSIWGIPAIVKNEEQKACSHEYVFIETLADATCKTKGKLLYECELCDKQKTEEVAALGHDEVSVAAIAATCTDKGWTDGVKCKTCDEWVVKPTEISALGHSAETLAAQDPTCNEQGLTEGSYCKRCDEVLVEQKKLPATGHALVNTSGVAATCTKSGYTSSSKCKTCGEVFEEKEIIAALGHSLEYFDALAPTCVKVGYAAYEDCTRVGCSHNTYKEIAALGHAYVEGVCSRCGYELEDNHEHNYDYQEVVVAATCETNGTARYVCYCGDTKTETIAATGHSYDQGVITAMATCEGTGEKTFTCGSCAKSYTEILPALGHNYGTGVVTVAATCTSDGVMTSTCLTCNNKKSETILTTGHAWNDGVITQAATCEDDGLKTYVCQLCAEKKTETIYATGHNYVGDSCKVCGIATEIDDLTPTAATLDPYTRELVWSMPLTMSLKNELNNSNKELTATVSKRGSGEAVNVPVTLYNDRAEVRYQVTFKEVNTAFSAVFEIKTTLYSGAVTKRSGAAVATNQFAQMANDILNERARTYVSSVDILGDDDYDELVGIISDSYDLSDGLSSPNGEIRYTVYTAFNADKSGFVGDTDFPLSENYAPESDWEGGELKAGQVVNYTLKMSVNYIFALEDTVLEDGSIVKQNIFVDQNAENVSFIIDGNTLSIQMSYPQGSEFTRIRIYLAGCEYKLNVGNNFFECAPDMFVYGN